MSVLGVLPGPWAPSYHSPLSRLLNGGFLCSASPGDVYPSTFRFQKNLLELLVWWQPPFFSLPRRGFRLPLKFLYCNLKGPPSGEELSTCTQFIIFPQKPSRYFATFDDDGWLQIEESIGHEAKYTEPNTELRIFLEVSYILKVCHFLLEN